MKAQYAILRFAKYKGPEIGHIESHNERTKEKYASNPDVDTSRSHLNFHLVTPQRKYRAEAEKQIAEAGCRTRSDSVRVVEALVTASPEFFKGKKKGEIKAYFQEALNFIREHQDPKTIISAVVHMDEKTPHMHLCFVPLTADGRLSAKEIVGNKKKLTQWQDRFWEHMVKKYHDLERGESASETGRDHIPPRVFKEMTRLTKQKAKLHRDYEDVVAVLDRFPKEVLAHIHTGRRKRGRLPMVDEWSGFAALLANLIEKYAVVLNLDALPDLVIEEAVSEKDDTDKDIHENDIEPVKAA